MKNKTTKTSEWWRSPHHTLHYYLKVTRHCFLGLIFMLFAIFSFGQVQMQNWGLYPDNHIEFTGSGITTSTPIPPPSNGPFTGYRGFNAQFDENGDLLFYIISGCEMITFPTVPLARNVGYLYDATGALRDTLFYCASDEIDILSIPDQNNCSLYMVVYNHEGYSSDGNGSTFFTGGMRATLVDAAVPSGTMIHNNQQDIEILNSQAVWGTIGTTDGAFFIDDKINDAATMIGETRHRLGVGFVRTCGNSYHSLLGNIDLVKISPVAPYTVEGKIQLPLNCGGGGHGHLNSYTTTPIGGLGEAEISFNYNSMAFISGGHIFLERITPATPFHEGTSSKSADYSVFGLGYGLEFTLDHGRLYYSVDNKIGVLDFVDPSDLADPFLLASPPTIIYTHPTPIPSHLELGRDGKIYFTDGNSLLYIDPSVGPLGQVFTHSTLGSPIPLTFSGPTLPYLTDIDYSSFVGIYPFPDQIDGYLYPSSPSLTANANFSVSPSGPSYCVGELLTFTSTDPSGTHQWMFGDGTTSSLPHPSHSYSSSGFFVVKHIVSNTCGSDTVTKFVLVNPLPSDGIIVSPATGPYCWGETICFMGVSDASDPDWNWSIHEVGIGTIHSSDNLVYYVPTSGNLIVDLQVTDLSTGCTSLGVSQLINTENCCIINDDDFCNLPDGATLCIDGCIEVGPCMDNNCYQFTWSHEEITTKGNPPVSVIVTVIDGTGIGPLCLSPDETTTYTLTVENICDSCMEEYDFTINVDTTCYSDVNNSCCGIQGGGPGMGSSLAPTFQSTYGTPGIETVGNSNPALNGAITQLSDQGYVMAGYTDQVSFSDYSDYYLIKADFAGNMEWQKVYGDLGFNFSTDISTTSDGGLILAGGSGYENVTIAANLAKLHANGNVMWDKTYTGLSLSNFRAVIETSDGGFLAGGYTLDAGESFVVVKTDANGNPLWHNLYGSGNSYFSRMIEVSDGYILVGSILSGGVNGYVLKLDFNGNVVWSNQYGQSSAMEEFYDIVEMNNGNLIIGGYTTQSGSMDGLFVKLNSQGAVIKARIYGGSGDENFNSIVHTSDNRFVFSGRTNSYNTDGSFDLYTAKMKGNGTEIWSKTFGDVGEDEGRDVIETFDDGLAFFGSSEDDFFLVKTNKDGESQDGTYCGSNDQDLLTLIGQITINSTPAITTANPIPNFTVVDDRLLYANTSGDYDVSCYSDCPIANAGQNIKVCPFEIFTLDAGSNPSFTYQWYVELGNYQLPISSSSTLTLFGIFPGQYFFTVEVTDPATGCSDTDEVKVKVRNFNHPDCAGNNLGTMARKNSETDNAISIESLINAESKEDQLLVYPNPATDQVMIYLSSEEGQDNIVGAIIEITDMRGRLVKHEQVSVWTGTHTVDVSNLERGIYTLTVKSSIGTLGISQIIIQ